MKIFINPGKVLHFFVCTKWSNSQIRRGRTAHCGVGKKAKYVAMHSAQLFSGKHISICFMQTDIIASSIPFHRAKITSLLLLATLYSEGVKYVNCLVARFDQLAYNTKCGQVDINPWHGNLWQWIKFDVFSLYVYCYLLVCTLLSV